MKNIFTKLLLAVVVLLIGIWIWKDGFSDSRMVESSGDSTVYQNLSASEFDEQIKSADRFLLDVHTPEQQHIAGTDAYIPYDDLEKNTDRLPQSKDTQILVYCRSGGMSTVVAETLLKLGYTNVRNLVGGKSAYDEYLAQNQSDGKLTITPDNQDLGTVVYGDVPETNFTIKNNTTQLVNLTRVSTSCGCTKALPEKESLQPKESIDLKVTFDPAVHGDTTDLGDLTRTIYVQTDHPDFPRFENTIMANVIKP